MKKYYHLLRANHWFKNIIVLLGVFLASIEVKTEFIPKAILAFILSSVVSSVNYIINQIADRHFDSHHPEKKSRPIPSGEISIKSALTSATLLLVSSLAISYLSLSTNFSYTLTILFLAGVAYNIKPIRTKDIPYLDVISESFNNPVRFLLGWFVILDTWPPLTLVLFTWTFGAVFMTAKRYDELVFFGKKLGPYRATFNTYTPERLLTLMTIYSLLSVFLMFFTYPLAVLALVLFLLWFITRVKSGQARARDIENFVLHPFKNHK